jgi:hypothetical protein
MNERHAGMRKMPRVQRVSIAIVSASALFALGACSGGGGKGHLAVGQESARGGASTGGNSAQFCRDYAAAADAYTETMGDVTDPSFDQFMTLLAKAKAEAPPAVAAPVADMYSTAVRIQRNNGTADLSSDSLAVTDWANANCFGQ